MGSKSILDVVYNHTAEGNKRAHHLFRGIDNAIYYIGPQGKISRLTQDAGNTFNCNHPAPAKLISTTCAIGSSEMHVDGFRFDLASILTRRISREPLSAIPPVIEAITNRSHPRQRQS